MVNQERSHQRIVPVLVLMVINTSSNGGNHSRDSAGSSRMTMMLGRTVMAVSMMPGTGESMP